MINLILHPGHSKCGSTTIQDFIYKNRHIFLKRGVFLPDVNFNFSGFPDYNLDQTQTPRDYLAKIQSGDVPLSDLEAKLDKLIDNAKELGCRRVIISAENLINAIGSPMTSAIHKLFNRKFASVNVVYYIRKQSDLFVSAWQQWGHKNGESLNDYIEKMSQTNFGDFNAIVTKLHKYYPKKNINVFPLNKKSLTNNDLIEDFCFRGKIMAKGLQLKVESSNSGLSSALCRTISNISSVYSSVHDQSVKYAVVNLTPNSSKLREKKYSSDISPALREVLIARFEEGNKLLHQTYFPDVIFEQAISLVEPVKAPEPIDENIHDKVARLEDLVTIQMDMILQLSNRLNNDK